MTIFGKPRGEKYHTRTIETTTYDYDDLRMVVEGTLTDHRFMESRLATGQTRLPGTLHRMVIRLLLSKADLTVEDLEVIMPVVPRDDCRETLPSLDAVKGLRIGGGFTAKVREIAGGVRGCNHLVALLTAMASSTIQGYGAYYEHKFPGFLLDHYGMLMNTCRVWREDGPLIAFLKEKRRERRRA